MLVYFRKYTHLITELSNVIHLCKTIVVTIIIVYPRSDLE